VCWHSVGGGFSCQQLTNGSSLLSARHSTLVGRTIPSSTVDPRLQSVVYGRQLASCGGGGSNLPALSAQPPLYAATGEPVNQHDHWTYSGQSTLPFYPTVTQFYLTPTRSYTFIQRL